MDQQIRVIKKYANRRLYDTSTSRYITLDDVKKLVLDEVAFRIIEASSGADITKSTLLLIISEAEEDLPPIFSVEVLQHFIRAYGNNMQNFLNQYLERMLSQFIAQKESLLRQPSNTYKTWLQDPYNWLNEILQSQQNIWEPKPATTKPKTSKAPKKAAKKGQTSKKRSKG